ncbi:hypothetical protein HUJ04_011589 [Dendroctonus ponderosae]|nr:hypothetical protein HUJ04_011589 [Dendroctonus ponderosae]KAH1028736.1 hypothetical protein HUJ05_002067 [Dendroctonus ponderosae]
MHSLSVANTVVQACKLLELVIARRLSPSMSLLIDCNEDLTELGPTLYHKCFTTEWEVRKSALELINTITISANTSFASFKHILIEASLPHLISTMALNDEHHLVRAAAFKCLQEMFEWNDIENIIPRNPYINKVLDVLATHIDPLVKAEMVKLVRIACLNQEGLEDAVLSKVYRSMEQIMSPMASSLVQVEGLQFWCSITIKHLSQQGWLDRKFPSVTFSKRIISMTNQEVRKRVYKALNELTAIGCLSTLVKVARFENLSEEPEKYLNKILLRFNELFREHDITPESMVFNQEFEDMPHVSNCNFSTSLNLQQTNDSDKLLQEIIDDTVMKMIPDDLEFCQDEDLYTLIDEKFARKNAHFVRPLMGLEASYTTPAEFVDFVFQRIAYITCRKDSEYNKNMSSPQLKSADVYNIIDY